MEFPNGIASSRVSHPVAASLFTARVLSAVRRIPPGRAATYGDIATLAGRPRAWRAVGNIMRSCQSPATPCHRVVSAGGALGGYGGYPGMKRALLRAEGIVVVGTRIRGWRFVRWPSRHDETSRRNRQRLGSVFPRQRRPAR
jgi:methylated-DNA-protein-cysteine methyltransferase-like protein